MEEQTEKQSPTTLPVEYHLPDAAIALMSQRYMPLTVAGIDDKAGLKIVKAARLDVKAHRCAVERRRKDLKADALDWGKRVDTEAKRITALLEPIEAHLEAEENKVAAELARLATEAAEKRHALIQARIAGMAQYGAMLSIEQAAAMDEASYANLLAGAKLEHEDRQAKLAAEQKAREEEAARLEAERKRQADEDARLKAEREKLEAERRALEQQKTPETPSPVMVNTAPMPGTPPPVFTSSTGEKVVVTPVVTTARYPVRPGFCFLDGDALCVTRTDFINLQESPAVFVVLEPSVRKAIRELLEPEAV